MPGSAAPYVRLSRSALETNARALLSDGGVVDLRYDAYGHGASEVAPIVLAAGASSVFTDGANAATAVHDVRRLFGIPDADGTLASHPVMTLEGRVLSTKPLRTGEAVSYGYTHRAQHDTRVALVSGGYAQGILRALGNRARVQIGGRVHPIVGRIAMDVCVVDLEGSDCATGTPACYFGGTGAMSDALAHWSAVTGLAALEMAVVVGQHVERRWMA